MSHEIKLSVESRDVGKPGLIRRAGFVPAIIYGENDVFEKPKPIKIKKLDFEKIHKAVGQHGLVNLSVDDKREIKVIIKDIQRDPITNMVIHADFYCVNMKEKIITEVPVMFVGESNAVKNMGGILVKQLDSIKVRCLPDQMIDSIEVDLSALEDLHSSIHVRDVKFPKALELITDPDHIVVNVTEVKKTIDVSSATPGVASDVDNKAEIEQTKAESK